MQRLLILLVFTASVFSGPIPQDFDEGQSSSNLEFNHDGNFDRGYASDDEKSSKDGASEQESFGDEEQSGFEDQQRGGFEDEGTQGDGQEEGGEFGERRDRFEDGESGESPGDGRKDF